MSTPDAIFEAFVDDASALLPDEVVPLGDAASAFGARASDQRQGRFLARDTDVPQLREFAGPLAVLVTGGAGQIAGPAGLCARLGLDLTRLNVVLRDPGDLRGNARRVVAAVYDAQDAGALDDATEVCVEIPGGGSAAGWLDAADEVSAAEHRLALRAGVSGNELVSWIDASLDRETPFTVHGLARAVTGDSAGPGFLNVLVATQLLFDGGSAPAGALAETDPAALLERTTPQDLLRARRWFTSFASDDVEASLHDLDVLPEGWAAG